MIIGTSLGHLTADVLPDNCLVITFDGDNWSGCEIYGKGMLLYVKKAMCGVLINVDLGECRLLIKPGTDKNKSIILTRKTSNGENVVVLTNDGKNELVKLLDEALALAR